MRSTRQVIRVAIVENIDLTREGLYSLLNASSDFTCVGSWSSAEDAMAALNALSVDVILIDAKLPNQVAFDVLRAMPT